MIPLGVALVLVALVVLWSAWRGVDPRTLVANAFKAAP